MRTTFNAQIFKMLLALLLAGTALSFGSVSLAAPSAAPTPSKYYSVITETLPNGMDVDKTIINGPPAPPPGFEVQRQAVSLPEPDSAASIKTLTVPAFNWVFGCSAVSGAMVAGYYDRTGYPNMYTGPTNGGVMPLDNSSWPTWSDGFDTYPNCPLIASKNGVDGRTSKGSIDDYWVQYGSTANDPYITGSWIQHAWGTAIGDYMKTSQSAYGNTDGSTSFYNYTNSALPLTCADMASYGINDLDGTYGRKLFYEARGYTVTDCYSQQTDNKIAGGFSFNQYKAEIDAGRPVLLNLAGHSIVGVGYDDTTNTVYIHDTWDYSNHTMTWGGSYAGMELLSVSVVNLGPTEQNAITVVSPNGGETLIRGTILPISWSYTGNPGANVKIELYSGSTLSRTITASTPLSAGSYNWTIPSTQTAGSNYTIKVTSTTDSTISDTSDGAFSIVKPTITVNSPNGGETVLRTAVVPITWSYTGNPGANVKIQLYKGNILNRTIALSTPLSAGSYAWKVSSLQSLGSDYKIKITSTTDSTISDASNGTFTIAKPSVTVISPNGGESFTRGSTMPISWTSVGSPGSSVKILLYKGFFVSRTITTSTPLNAGTYNWTIPSTQTLGSTYKIKIVSTTNSLIADTSNTSFTIK